MKFSEEFEARFTEMISHYPTRRSALVPTLLYAQDEAGALTDEVIAELAQRLELTELEVRNVISYYSMLTPNREESITCRCAPTSRACSAVARNCLTIAKRSWA